MTVINLQHPWQSGPTELIEYAITLLHQETDFQHRMAFLLLDVGAETLLKTYLTLSDSVTGSKTKWNWKEKGCTRGELSRSD